MIDKFLTKENIFIAIISFAMILQSNYFATKLDVANIKNEMLSLEIRVKEYSDTGDKELLHELDNKYNIIINKLDKMR